MKVALFGATGRMGRTIARILHECGDSVVGACAHANDPNQGTDIGTLAGIGEVGTVVGEDFASSLLGAEVVIDFSIASAVPEFANIAARAGVPIVTGTTNLGDEGTLALDRASVHVPVVWARNMSLGVEVLAGLVEQAIRRLGPDYDVEIVELHHRRKVDSPSGTALRLADAVSAARPGTRRVTGRDGQVGARTNEEIGIFGVRGGDVIGDHTVHILGPGERLELTHRATNRELFAQGAVRAARFVVGKPPGRYSLADVLG
jgi:4-hydroxy-tetrahydrodipicolinate reductase